MAKDGQCCSGCGRYGFLEPYKYSWKAYNDWFYNCQRLPLLVQLARTHVPSLQFFRYGSTDDTLETFAAVRIVSLRMDLIQSGLTRPHFPVSLILTQISTHEIKKHVSLPPVALAIGAVIAIVDQKKWSRSCSWLIVVVAASCERQLILRLHQADMMPPAHAIGKSNNF